MNYSELVCHIIERYKSHPIDLLNIGENEGRSEYNYLIQLKDTYVRTVKDIDSLFNNSKHDCKILEIGAFLGVVSLSLKKIGYNINASEIPEFYNSKNLQELFKINNIPFNGFNLRNCKLPYESNSFDAIILCEVLEHLNFNPLPVIRELNRILKLNGILYIGMSNQARIINRLRLLFGKSLFNSIDDYFKQFDRSCNMLVGLHWREYTMNEAKQLVESMGFENIKSYYFDLERTKNRNIVKQVIKKIIFSIPSFRSFQVIIARKIDEPYHDFWFTEANM